MVDEDDDVDDDEMAGNGDDWCLRRREGPVRYGCYCGDGYGCDYGSKSSKFLL